MTADSKMRMEPHYKHLRRMQRRCRQAPRQDNRALLDETGAYGRDAPQSVIGRLIGFRVRPKAGAGIRRSPSSFFGGSGLCVPGTPPPGLPATAELLEAHRELALTPTLREELTLVSHPAVHVLTGGDLCSTATMHSELRSAVRVLFLPHV